MRQPIYTAMLATLLSLAACAKQEDPVAGSVEALGNDGIFASENVILPGENVTDASLANLSVAPANTN